ncbi:MAG: HEAT repeat domain-containing protein [Thermoguttaceae bacterium]|nr:HEAT repeat domain-containing protein [Thermoguttaceae bacterium]
MKRILLTLFFLGALLVCSVPLGTVTAADEAEGVSAAFAELAPDLGSDDLGKLERAEQRLQKLCFEVGAPGREADKAELNHLMTSRLAEPINAVAKTWILFQLSRTGTDDEVDAIAACLADPDFRVRQQALRTLVTIKSDKALDAAKSAAETADPQFKKEIEQTLKVAFYDLSIPVETEWPLCLPYVDDSEVEAWLAGFDSMDVTTKARTVASLAVRNDRKYRPYVLKAIESDDPDLRVDGIIALEKLGTPEDIPLLIRFAKDPAVERYAIVAADRIEYPGFDEAVLEGLKKADDPEDFFNFTKIVVARNNYASLPVIFDGAAKYEPYRTSLLVWSERLVGKDDLPRFIDLTLQIKNAADQERLQRCITRISGGDAKPILPLITPANRNVLVPLIGRIGGEEAFDYMMNMFKTGNGPEKELAVKGMANLPNAEHAETLIAIATDPKISEAGRVAALRAYIRVMSLPEDEIGIQVTDNEKLDALKAAFDRAERDEEKNLVLERLKAVRLPETLSFVLPFMDDPRFVDAATTTVLGLAHHDFLRKEDPQLFSGALNKVIEMNLSADWVDAARRYLNAMNAGK